MYITSIFSNHSPSATSASDAHHVCSPFDLAQLSPWSATFLCFTPNKVFVYFVKIVFTLGYIPLLLIRRFCKHGFWSTYWFWPTSSSFHHSYDTRPDLEFLVLKVPVMQTRKRPRLNQTVSDRTGLLVPVLPVAALVWSTVHWFPDKQETTLLPA